MDDDGKVVALVSSRDKVEPPPRAARKSNPDLVEYAEGILERAKSGELMALAFAEVKLDDEGHQDTNGGFIYIAGTAFAMAFALERLMFRIKENMFDR